MQKLKNYFLLEFHQDVTCVSGVKRHMNLCNAFTALKVRKALSKDSELRTSSGPSALELRKGT